MKKKRLIVILVLSVLCCLSLFAACAKQGEKEPEYHVSFKADYGFEKHSVTKKEVGLGEKEFYWQNFNTRSAYSYDMVTEYQYDEFLTKLAIEGMLNREDAILYLDRGMFQGGEEYNVGADGLWPDFYADTTRQGLVQKDIEYGLPALLDTFAEYFNGVILYSTDFTEKNPSTNLVMALNLANANFCIPVSKTYYYKYREHFQGLPLVADVSNTGLTQMESYDWLLRNLYKGKDVESLLNKHTVHSLCLNFPDNRQSGGWHNIMGVDYAFSEKVFMFNLAASATSTQMYGNPIYADRETEQTVNTILKNIDSDAMPAPILGWNEREPDWAEKVSEYGHFVECTAAAGNLSFHSKVDTVKPIDEIMENGLQAKAKSDFNREGENGKVYIAFLANEADAIKTRTLMYNQAWNYKDENTGGGRGAFPITWGINPRELLYTPALVEYFYDTATENDYFYGAPTGGAGYCNLAVNPDIERYIETAKPLMELLDLQGADFWYSNGATIEKVAEGLGLKAVTLDGNPQYASGGAYWFGENDDIPGLRYSARNFYWMNLTDSVTGKGVYVDNTNGYSINADAFFEEFANYRSEDKPAFIPFYGMEANLAVEFYNKVMLDPRWEDAKVEVVDLATLVSMSGKYQAKYSGVKPDITEDDYENLDPKFLEQMGDASNWTTGSGIISTGTDGKLRFTVTNLDKWGLMEIYYTYVPPTATSITVSVARGKTVDGREVKDTSLQAVVKMTVDRNHNGVLERENNVETEYFQGAADNLTIKLTDASVKAIKQGAMVGIEVGYVGHAEGNFIRINGIEFGGAVDPGSLPKFNTNVLTDTSYWSNPDINAMCDNAARFEVTDAGVKVSLTGWGNVNHSGILPIDTAGIRVRVSGTPGMMIDLKFVLPSGRSVFYHDYNAATNAIPEGGTLEYVLGWSDFKATNDDALALREMEEVALRGEDVIKIYLGGSTSDQSAGYIVYEEFTMIGSSDFNEMRNPYFEESLMQQPDLWQMYSGGTVTPCADGKGFVITNETAGWELASIAKKIPVGAKYIKMTLGEVKVDQFVFKIHGDLDNFGVEDSWYRQGVAQTGAVIYYKIDPRIIASPDQTFKVQLGFVGNGSIEYKGFQFMTQDEYYAEVGFTDGAIGAPDEFGPNGDYNIDKDNDGIRDGDKLGNVSKLSVKGGELTFKGVEGAEYYIVEIYTSDGKLFTTRQTSTETLSLRFLKSGEYTFKVYASANNRADSDKVSVVGKI